MIGEAQNSMQYVVEERRRRSDGARWAAWEGYRGQSLVEMAIMTPLLLLMFIGVVEVGWALRGYLVLVNVDREAARFAARAVYLDPSQVNIEDVGYQRVVSHTMDSLSGQLPLDFTSENPNATMIITLMVIDTGYPCDNSLPGNPPCNDTCDNPPCDCSAVDKREPGYPTDDQIVLPPPIGPGYSDATVAISNTFRAVFGIGEPVHTTRIADDLWERLREENNAINCGLMAKNPDISPSANSGVIVEIFYEQPQLLGVPLVSNYFTDPIPLYAHTMMRIPDVRRPQQR